MRRRSWGVTVAGLALVASACSSITAEELNVRAGVTLDGVASPAETGPHPAPEVFSDEYWAHLELPEVFSDVVVVDGVALFEVVEDRMVSLVALDVTNGEILYRYPTHPYLRLRGVSSAILASAADGIVVRTEVIDNDGRPDARVFGHDIASGEPRWVVRVDAEAYPAFDCGGTFCVRSRRGQTRYDYETGAVLDTAPIVGDGFAYATLENGFLLTETDDAFVGSSDFGMGPSWRLPFAEVGVGFGSFFADRSNGWGVVFDGEVGAIHWAVGDETLRAGFDIRSGELLWSMKVPHPPCDFGVDDAILECWSYSERVEVRRRDITTGEEVWTAELPVIEWPTLDESAGLVQVASQTDDPTTFFLALDDGRRRNDPGYRLCAVSAGTRPVFLPWAAPTAWEWRGRIHPGVCDDEWIYRWLFDLVVDDTELSTPMLTEGVDGWSVGVDSDVLIVGIRTG